MTTIYFAPHQDDELIVLGVDIAHQTEIDQKNTHVWLCTDGSASCVHRCLADGSQDCTLHTEPHHFQMTSQEFTAARDREYTLSCRSMGVLPENIHISPLRRKDQGLTVEAAEAIMLDAISQFPTGEPVVIHTLSDFYAHRKQQDDHRNLAIAARNLLLAGKVQKVVLALEYEALVNCRETFPDTEFTDLHADPKEYEKLAAAAGAYRRWAPEEGFYAVGYHSCQHEFVALLKDPRTVLHHYE